MTPSRTTKPATSRVTLDPRQLHRFLYGQSSVFTGAAHALEGAADRLRAAHGSDYTKAATELRLAALSAIHAALSAHRLVGEYELAAWLERAHQLKIDPG